MDILEDFPINGYDIDNEPRDLLALHESESWKVGIPTMGGIPGEMLVGAALESLSDPGIIFEDQGRTNGCAGFSDALLVQGSIWLATQQYVNLSGMWAYTESQRAFGGLFGRDAGAFLEGCRKVNTGIGLCEEQYMPFGGSYYYFGANDQKRKAALENAKQYVLPTGITLKGYQDCWDWIASGHGMVHIGVQFPTDWYGPQPYILPRWKGRSRVGGHAVCVSGWSFTAVPGTKLVEIFNPWKGWGRKGRGLAHMDDVKRLLDEPSSTRIGYSHRRLDDKWRSWDVGWVQVRAPKIKIDLGGSAGATQEA